MRSAAPTSRVFKMVLAYDGTEFHGWQVQPGLATVQGLLAGAIEAITAESVLPQGSGRTDAGVHAEGQVASFALRGAIPAESLQRALNRRLPGSVRVLALEEAAADFHARHCAKGKTYEYRIHTGEICPPMLARYVHCCPWRLDFERMQAAAAMVVGERDFSSFAAIDPDASSRAQSKEEQEDCVARDAESQPSNVRTIFVSNWRRDGELLTYSVSGSGFLHHMVRNLVGTFIEVGRGRFEPQDVAGILEARDRCAAGPTAPAKGLFLMSVDY